jgi:hypothetical protein
MLVLDQVYLAESPLADDVDHLKVLKSDPDFSSTTLKNHLRIGGS